MDPDDVSADLLDKAIDDLVDAHFTRYIDGILSRITGRDLGGGAAQGLVEESVGECPE